MTQAVLSEAVARQFSRAAPQYDRLASIQQHIAAQAIRQIPVSSGRLLDIGCGTGRNTALLAERGFDASGADLARGMVEYASLNYPHLSFCVADAQHLPFNNDAFDVVFSSMAMQWCQDINLAMSEVARILRHAGIATLSIMTDGSFGQLNASRRASGLSAVTNIMASHEKWLTAAQESGFTVLQAENIAYTDTFADILSLLRSIKSVGAGVRCDNASVSALSRRQLTLLESAYQRYKTPEGLLPLTYRVSHLVLEKQ
ncbi:methyltransferase domain-containing protein [Salinimonas sp. HHU 13199]|uniref:Malonyl-[acyl-carrier protein] O-methyltransferase n=1 Tax=Salinimonas profundi TaxID=2729140 RepID=A0ABR8LIE8_9ALTE|nr:methyltransferase domain-containing protein [Salinimonas profundi]MBD3585090.1 methyltransferase domain-containing protein [Salinimonas profundi]